MNTHAVFTNDPDKAVCGIRLSAKPGRTAATSPYDVDCDTCALKVLRSLQQMYPGVRAVDLPNVWPPGVGRAPGAIGALSCACGGFWQEGAFVHADRCTPGQRAAFRKLALGDSP